MESPVRIKSGAAVLLAFCVFLEVCNGFPNQNATAVKESKEQNSSEVETTLVFPNTTPRFLPRPSTWKFQRKVSNLTQYVTPVPSVVNVTLIRNDASDSIITTTPSGSKIHFRGSVRYFTTRLPFKPKIPHSRKNITKPSEEIDNDSAHTTEATRLASASDQSNKIAYNRRISFKLNLAAAESVANVTTVLPEVLSVSSLTTQKSIETKKEKQNSVEPAKYTRRNNTRYREEVSEKPVIVTTEYPSFKKSTTTRKSFEPKKDKQNIVESTRYNRRNFNRSRDEASEKSNINITRQPFVYRGKSTTINPIEDARERHNSIESTEDYRSVNRSEVGKSLDLGFNIDKYTSDDFHDINNVYSQSISPEIEHFIIPENVSDYFVNVNSGSFVPPADNYLASAMSLSTPHMDFFDKKFKEVSEGIKKNIAIAAAEYASEKSSEEQSTAESAETEVDNVNFDELLSLPPNNNTNIMFKNTKEITITDLKGPTNSYMDFTDSNGTNILFERETLSTESYDTSSVTVRTYPTENDSQNDEATTPTALESNRINIVSTIDNRVPKSDSTVNRRIDHFRTNNATRKEFLTTIRMKAYTTPKPRIRISLKSNRNFRNITAPTIKTEDATSTKAPEVVKMLPFTRRRNTLTTVASNIDPVLQESDSPTRVLDYSKSDRDNSIPALRKRGSPGKNSNTTSSNVTENDLSPQFTIPPTAWALITLRDTPNAKKSNATNSLEAAVPLPTDNIIKTENILQKLNKPLETHSQASNPQPVYEKYPAVSTSKKSNDEATSSSVGKINNHVTSPSDIVTPSKEGSNKSRDTIKTVQKEVIPDSDHSYSSYESITKLPHDFTTPLDDESPDSTSVNFMPIDYYGPTSIDESNDDNTENYTTETYPDTDESNPSLSMNHNVEATTMMHIPIPELFTFPTEDSDSDTSIVSTTEVVARKTTPLSTSTVATDDDVSTTETTTKITTATNEFGSFKPKQYTTTYNSFSRRTTNTPLDNDVNDLIQTTTHRIQDVGVKSVSESNAATSRSATYRITTTTDDDLDDFSFSTIPSSTVQDTTVESPKSTTGNALSSDATTTEIKNTSEDIVAASTMYYGTTKANNADMTTAYFSQTTHAVTTIKNDPLTESVAALTTTQKSADAREAKHKIVIDDEDKTTNSANSSDQNSDDWQDTSDPNSEIKTNDLLNNINITNTDDSSELDREIIGVDNDLPGYNRNESMSESATEPHNIEVIKMNMPDASDRETYVKETTTEAGGDTEKYDAGDGTGTVAAIAISVIGVIALLLLVIFLMVARGRRSGGGYGQRCTPVSLDSYSLDNVSVSGSTRRKARRPSKRSYGNPAYDESGATSHPMQFAALANFSLDQESIVSEFNDIPSITVRADEVPPGCESKNRFSNVIPLPETRVSLKPIPGDDTSDYINANYVRGPKNLKNYYIACQAPLASTVNDFWRMIWEQNSRVILMLTEFMENGVEKCFEYIPPSEVSDNRRVFGDYQVTVKKREIRDKYIISQLQVKSLGTHTWREVTHMWYFWPAKGVPDECNSIIAFLIEARSYLKASQNAKEYDEDGHDSLITHNGSLAPNQTQITIDPDEGNSSEMNIYNVQRGEKTKNGTAKNGTLSNKDGTMRGGPMVVHCSPGTGRTGAVLACDIGIRDFEMNRTVDVPKTVYRIRRDRANCVQTKDQYIFIYKVLSEYATKLTGGVLDSI